MLLPAAPPGGAATKEYSGQRQYPDSDGNCNFAHGEHTHISRLSEKD